MAQRSFDGVQFVMKAFWHVLTLAILVAAGCDTSHVHMDINSTTTDFENGAHRFGATTDGQMTWWTVRFADVKMTPDWFPGEEPPLSLATAVQLVEREIPTYSKTPDAYRLDKVEWVPIAEAGTRDSRKWFYVVTYEREYRHNGRSFDARGTLTVPVLSDGRVIQGVKE
jgi:hypothetical protein